MLENIVVKGARENNLKNVDITIPRNKLVVFTGVSGSGKSTLAFDTIFAEGQRRYIESLSSYARMFLGQMGKPDVDLIDGLSPAISIDQKTTSHNPRSIVGTVTEIYDYLRLLFAHLGTPYCPKCNKPITSQTIDTIIEKIQEIELGSKLMILAPIAEGKKGTFASEFDELRKDGFARVVVDGRLVSLDEEIALEKNIRHDVAVVVDRLILKDGISSRLTESVETAIKLTDGFVVVDDGKEKHTYSTKFSCLTCGYSVSEILPRNFSFNSPFGACTECDGLGFKQIIDRDKIVKAPKLSLFEGCIYASGWGYDNQMANIFYRAVMNHFNLDFNTPWYKMPKAAQDMVLYGTKGEKIKSDAYWLKNTDSMSFEGVIPNLERRYRETHSDMVKNELGKLLSNEICPDCHGNRLKKESLAVKINKKNIIDVCNMSIKDCYEFFKTIKYTSNQEKFVLPILKEINARLEFLLAVGLDYLTLSRPAGTLSGGEAQRIRLATQIGSGLTGVLYILDEPSIGLHQRDNDKLIETLKKLRDLGNTVLVVEHDEDTMREADYIVDIGPLAGVHGGEIVAKGTIKDIEKETRSITGKYLSGEEKILVPEIRRKIEKGFISIKGAKQNNLKNIDVDIPLGVFTCVTGVSGSGKSSLINEILYPATYNYVNKSELPEGKYSKIIGLENIDKVINIDQSPIGKTPRSNPATYVGVFTDIRELFAQTVDSKERGYDSGRFSFNVTGGRCENCGGAGINKIEMFFLPDVYVTCDVCGGKRYNRETLEVKYKGKNISDVLNMTIEEANKFFENIPKIKQKLQTLVDVGLGYIKVGQPATELSGGEAQRVKLASELCKKSTGKSLYILDEPTTGLHLYDIDKLLKILKRLVDSGNTVVVIEHNLDVIKCSDYIIDLGKEGGDKGGEVLGTGTPEEIAKLKESYTGIYLKKYLNK